MRNIKMLNFILEEIEKLKERREQEITASRKAAPRKYGEMHFLFHEKEY